MNKLMNVIVMSTKKQSDNAYLSIILYRERNCFITKTDDISVLFVLHEIILQTVLQRLTEIFFG
jgi:hypothetical protein